MPEFTLYTDGGARGNPGPAAAAFVVYDSFNRHLYTGGEFLNTATNNVAEYQGVLLGLKYIATLTHKPVNILIKLDSLLVAEQLSGHYKIKEAHLQELAKTAFHFIAANHLTVKYQHIPRAQNSAADAEVNRILDSLA
jgi:ribonuclease HI